MSLRTVLPALILAGLGWFAYREYYKPYAEARHRKKELQEAFFEAVLRGDVQRAERLLEAGVDINAKNRHGRTAFEIAAGQGWREMVEMLQRRARKAANVDQRPRRVGLRRSP